MKIRWLLHPIKNFLWFLQHPIYATHWTLYGKPYSAEK
jgi:hypothetical protein